MSQFYVIGCKKAIKNNMFNFCEFNINPLKFNKENIQLLKENIYYILLGNYYLGYNIKNISEFYSDGNKVQFKNFLNFIKNEINNDNEICLYKFWDGNTLCNNENCIQKTVEISTDIFNFPDDNFQFEFNIKYIFR